VISIPIAIRIRHLDVDRMGRESSASASEESGRKIMQETIRLGISVCLLGEKVRYDGGHKRDAFLTDTLGKFVEYVQVCPETECGLGVPRETLRLEGDPDHPRLINTQTRKDRTDQMSTWAKNRITDLEQADLCGFIFKKKSPSCGMKQVRVCNGKGGMVRKGSGIFARMFMNHFPLLPAEEEERLHDPGLRENFLERIFVCKRWRELLSEKKSRSGLTDFHTRHKLLIFSHSQEIYRIMGKLVAQAKNFPQDELYESYQKHLMESLAIETTPAKHADVLQHMTGYFKKQLSGDEKQELIELIEHYRIGYVPLIVPVTRINHFARKYDQSHLKSQYYLNPHPTELQLKNHA